MRPRAILWIALREPLLPSVLIFGPLGCLLLQFGSPAVNSALMALPVFLAVAAFFLPVDPYLATLPVKRADLILARLMATLLMAWAPLAVGAAYSLVNSHPLTKVVQPAEFGALLTAAILLAWTAYAESSRAFRWAAALLAAAAWIASLRYLPRAYEWSAIPIALAGIWVLVPFERLALKQSAHPAWIWPLLRSALSWQLLFQLVAGPLLGFHLSWNFAAAFAPDLRTGGIHRAWVLALPVNRRVLLWAVLLPSMVPFLAGAVASYHFGPPSWTFQTPGVPQSPPSGYWKLAPHGYPPEIRAPWGETSHPPAQSTYYPLRSPIFYNPYWAGPENSTRFIDWQFSRETAAIYGTPLSREQLLAAIRGGLRPLNEQSRMQFLTVALGIIFFLATALLTVANRGRRMRGTAWLPIALVVSALALFVPHDPGGAQPREVFQGWLMHLSPLLPHNNFLMTAVLMAAIAPLYMAVEIFFHRVEFPDKKMQETE